MNIKLNIVRRN